jgi:TonB family protein
VEPKVVELQAPYAFERRSDRTGWRLALALFAALLLHVGLAAMVVVASLLGLLFPHGERWRAERSPVALLGVPASVWDQRRTLTPQTAPAEIPPSAKPSTPLAKAAEKPKEPPPKPDGQVVDVEPGNDQKPEDTSRFLAEHNNRVQKESRAKETSQFYKNAMAKTTTTVPKTEATGHDPSAQKQVAGNQGVADDDAEKKASSQPMRQFEVPDVQKREQVALAAKAPNGEIHNQTESEAVRGNSQRLRLLPGTLEPGSESQAGALGRAGDRNPINLMPSNAAVDQITGAAAPDHLDDVDEGKGTYLNTREFKYATFFNRVKQRVGENWDPSGPLRQRDPEGRVYAYKDRYTLLNIALDDRGRLLQVTVEKSCGVDFLDHEAIAAFERAQPFPNPPPGMLDTSGQVKFNFGFFLEVNSSTPFRIFRSRD